MEREETTFRGGKNGECLLDDVDKEGGTENRPKRDRASFVPLPCASGKIKYRLEEGEDCGVEGGTEPVDLCEFCRPRNTWSWVVLRKEENVDWREECGEGKIDIKRPSPRCFRYGEATAN